VSVRLRPIEDSDAEAIVNWRNSDFVRQHFIFQDAFTVEMQLRWMENHVKVGKVAQFIIEADETPAGSVFLRDIDRIHAKGEFGIFLGDPRFAGQGVGAEATKQVLSYGFGSLGLNRIFLRALAGNKRAIRSYERSGFRHEGVLRQDVWCNGGYQDVVLMGVLRGDIG